MTFKCPACGGVDILADVTTLYSRVPIYPSGYNSPDGRYIASKIKKIWCDFCKARLEVRSWETDGLIELGPKTLVPR